MTDAAAIKSAEAEARRLRYQLQFGDCEGGRVYTEAEMDEGRRAVAKINRWKVSNVLDWEARAWLRDKYEPAWREKYQAQKDALHLRLQYAEGLCR